MIDQPPNRREGLQRREYFEVKLTKQTYCHQDCSSWADVRFTKFSGQKTSNGRPQAMTNDQDVVGFSSHVNQIIPTRSGVFGHAMHGRVSFTVTKSSVINCQDICTETPCERGVK